MRIGLVGEAPHDTTSVKILLEKKYPKEKYIFFEMQKRIRGSMLDNPKTKNLLRKEYETEKPDFLIFIRDLDSLMDNRKQFYLRKDYFRDFNSVVDKKGIFFLHIWEIEALILHDIECFNNFFNIEAQPVADVMKVTEPKELLKKFTKQYSEIRNSEIFEHVNFDKLLEVHYFKMFIIRFEKFIS